MKGLTFQTIFLGDRPLIKYGNNRHENVIASVIEERPFFAEAHVRCCVSHP